MPFMAFCNLVTGGHVPSDDTFLEILEKNGEEIGPFLTDLWNISDKIDVSPFWLENS